MATIGDLVVRLRMSNDTFAKNIQDSQRSARQLDYDVEKLRRSTLMAEDATNRLGRAMASPTARAAEWARIQAKSNQEVMQARQVNDRLAAALANTVVQTNQVTLATLELDRQLMQTQQQTRLLVATQSNATIQAQQLALAESQSAQSLLQAQGATAQMASQSQNAALFQSQLGIAVEQSKQAVIQATSDTQTYAAMMGNASVQANRLAVAEQESARNVMEMRNATAMMTAQAGSASLAQNEMALATERSNQSLLAAQGATAQLSAQSQNAAIFQNQLGIAVEQSKQAVIQATSDNQAYAAMMGNASVQANRLALAERESARASMEMKNSTAMMTAQAGSASIAHSELSIAIDRSNQAVIKERAELALLKRSLNDATIQTNQMELAQIRLEKTMLQQQSAMHGAGMSAGKAQLAISQLIFAVDDASTVYGTSGLSGAVRAAGNNLTMMAALMGGPYALAAAVAISAGLQLYLTFNKQAEGAKAAEAAEKAYQETLQKRHAVIEGTTRTKQEARGLDSEEALQKSIQQRADSIEVSVEKEYASRAEYDARKKEIEEVQAMRDRLAEKGGYWNYVMGDVSHVHMNVLSDLEKKLAELAALQNATATDINQQVADRKQKEEEINALLEEREAILQREQQAKDEANRKILNDLGAQMRSQLGQDAPGGEFRKTMAELNQRRDTIDSLAGGQEYHQLMGESNQLALQSLNAQASEVFRNLESSAKPKEGQKRSAVEEFNRQQELIKLYAPEDQQAGLLAMAQKTALRAFRDPQSAVKGPSGLEQGSREALERIRQRELDGNKPKQTQEQLMKEFLKKQDQMKDQEAKQTEWLQKIYLAQPDASDL